MLISKLFIIEGPDLQTRDTKLSKKREIEQLDILSFILHRVTHD